MAESLFVAMLRAPLVGVVPGDTAVLHAADMALIAHGWERGETESVCGVPGLKLVDGGDGSGVEWPPRVSSLPDGRRRCRACHLATGRKRPRSAFKPEPQEIAR